jgi:hypothetical protein
MIDLFLTVLLAAGFFAVLNGAWKWLARIGWAPAVEMLIIGWQASLWATGVPRGHWVTAPGLVALFMLGGLWWRVSGSASVQAWWKARGASRKPRRGPDTDSLV